MRYLRMLSNALLAAALAAAYIVVLVLQLNPTLPLEPARLAPLATTIGGFYTAHFTVIFYACLVGVQLFSPEAFSPAWTSVAALSWLCAAAALTGAGLMWANLRTFALVLPSDAASDLANGTLVLVASGALFVVVGVLRANVSRRRVGWAVLLVLVAVASVAAPLAIRGRGSVSPLELHPVDAPLDLGRVERPSRLTVLALDGGSLDLITSATAEGRLPNFGRIVDAGAVMHLATLHPTSAEAVWTAVATAKLPQKNGIRAAGTYHARGSRDAIQLLPDYCLAQALVRFGLVTETPHTAASLRTRPFWSMLTALGISVGLVGWPLTHPAPALPGFTVSDSYPRLAGMPSSIEDASFVYPADARSSVDAAIQSVSSHEPPAVPPPHHGFVDRPRQIDRAFDEIARALSRSHPAQVTVIRYQSLDPAGHYFLRYADPAAFGDVSDDERRRLGPLLEQHYMFIDAAIGRVMASLGPEDLLLVVSGYGMEPLGLGKRLLERLIGDPDLSGTHEGAPDGFLMAYGATVARGRLPRASIVDVVPTMLYFLGLPIGRDMDGYARTDIFQRSFTDDRPITFIPTYDQ